MGRKCKVSEKDLDRDKPIRYSEDKNLGEIVDDLIAIKDQDTARLYFEDVVASSMSRGLERDLAVQQARHNLGYLMGYAPTKINCAMWEKVGLMHPVFGSMAEGVQLTPEEIFEKGKEMGRNARTRR